MRISASETTLFSTLNTLIRRFSVFMLIFIVASVFMISGCAPSEPAKMLDLTGSLGVHDPVMIKEGDTYYVFATGGRPGRGFTPIKCSTDMLEWERCGNVFEDLPEWAPIEIPGTRGIWAPDISYFNGRYHLYYSISTFGKNNSAIGLATNKTLNPESADYEWIDHGRVVRSTRGIDDFNAIDANIAIEDEDNIWLSWGSFWGGIKMQKINPKTGLMDDQNTTMYTLSSRPRKKDHVTPPVEGAVEAPFIIKHGKYWYLFVSFDLCCRGADSTYNIVVGRSKQITGPYLDKEGIPMTEGGGSIVLEATGPNWRGPGHCAIYHEDRTDYLLFHAYHGQTGRSELKISTLAWQNNWPLAAELP